MVTHIEGVCRLRVLENRVLRVLENRVLSVLENSVLENRVLRVLENRALKKIYWPKRDEVKKDWSILHTESLVTCGNYQILLFG